MIQRISDIINASMEVKKDLMANDALLNTIIQSASCISQALKQGNRIYLCGNGGSAADAQHIAAELTGRFMKERPALAAEALHCNTSYLTAVANDYGYDHVYERYIHGIGKAGDILIGLSTSGNSKNVLLAIDAANAQKMISIGMTGHQGGQMKNNCKYWIGVPSDSTPRIQEAHILIGHILCELVDDSF